MSWNLFLNVDIANRYLLLIHMVKTGKKTDNMPNKRFQQFHIVLNWFHKKFLERASKKSFVGEISFRFIYIFLYLSQMKKIKNLPSPYFEKKRFAPLLNLNELTPLLRNAI